jgi:hypothetical protein
MVRAGLSLAAGHDKVFQSMAADVPGTVSGATGRSPAAQPITFETAPNAPRMSVIWWASSVKYDFGTRAAGWLHSSIRGLIRMGRVDAPSVGADAEGRFGAAG